jgi:signal transduction histidine kinase
VPGVHLLRIGVRCLDETERFASYPRCMDLEEDRVELAAVVDEQAALRRVAILVAAGATEAELAAAVSLEIGALFAAQTASVLRWDGDTIRVVGRWDPDDADARPAGTVFDYGGDTITARVVETAAPARIDSADELQTEFARERWSQLGLQASIGAPIIVDRKVWGVVGASRTRPGDVFAHGDETRLADFSALVAQAIVNADSRRETAALLAEQSSLRQIATLVAGGRPQAEVLHAVTEEAGILFGATSVTLVRWEGVQDEVVVGAAWSAVGTAPFPPGSLYHPDPDGPTLTVLETGVVCRAAESSPERGTVAVIAAPVIIKGRLFGALTAARDAGEPFPAGAEIRLRSFADLAAQSIANEHAQAELRSSRARIVHTADEARRRLERNLHDGAQQRLVSVALALRLVEQMFGPDSSTAKGLLQKASNELDEALHDLRELARGLHPALLSERGLAPALEAVTARCPFPVTITGVDPDRRLPAAIEAAAYYVVAESLTNVAKHAFASSATIGVTYNDASVTVEIADDGRGGADLEAGSGLRGLVDRVEAFGGDLIVSSPHGGGTLVRAELPLEDPAAGALWLPPKLSGGLAAVSSEVSWEPVSVFVSAEGTTAGEEMLRLLSDEYGATGEREGAWWKLTIRPIDQFRRGTIIYRVIQASRSIAELQPDAKIYLVTEDGNRWKLPPPALEPD